MTTCTVPTTHSSSRTSWLARLRGNLRAVLSGLDAAARIAHGSEVPPEHPARRRERERVELERRLAVRYPRT